MIRTLNIHSLLRRGYTTPSIRNVHRHTTLARSASSGVQPSSKLHLDPMSGKPTTLDDWVRSDRYHNDFLIPKDAVLEHAVKKTAENGLPDIAVTAAQGKFLKLLAQSIGAKRILEVGTLGGYAFFSLFEYSSMTLIHLSDWKLFYHLACASSP
jgi:hypothetical protein